MEGGAEPVNSAELGPIVERLQFYMASRTVEKRVAHQTVHDLIEENRQLKLQLQQFGHHRELLEPSLQSMSRSCLSVPEPK